MITAESLKRTLRVKSIKKKGKRKKKLCHLFVWFYLGGFSFTTEHTSVGLNLALGAVCEIADSEITVSENSQEIAYAFGIPEAIVSPYLHSGLLKGLNYCNGSYTAFLSPVWHFHTHDL